MVLATVVQAAKSVTFNAGSAFALSGAIIKTNPPPAKAFLISWPAVANGIYHVEFSTNSLGNWQLLCRCTNNAPTNRIISVWDTNMTSGSDRRFYRVGYGP